MKMEENNKHVQPNSKEEGVQRLNRILSESLIKATDTYKTCLLYTSPSPRD